MDSDSSTASIDVVPRKRKYYSGKSRTTKWRRRKKGISSFDGSCSGNANNVEVDQQERRLQRNSPDLEVQTPQKPSASSNVEASTISSTSTEVLSENGEVSDELASLHKDIGNLSSSKEQLSPHLRPGKDNSSFGNYLKNVQDEGINIPFVQLNPDHPVSHSSEKCHLENPEQYQRTVNKDQSNEDSSGNSSAVSENASPSASGSEYCPTSSNGSLSSGDLSFDLECFEANFLDEEPQEPEAEHQENHHVGGRGQPDSDSDPDDPPDPNDPLADNNPSSSEESDDNIVPEVATFTNNELNVNVRLLLQLTKGEIICLHLASATRHRMTFESLIDQFKNLNLLFGPGFFPESKTKLWSCILLNKAGIRFHVYCGRKECGRYIGRRDRLIEVARCRCGYTVPLPKAHFFVSLDWPTQLKYFLSIPGIWEKLQYPQTRRKISPTAIEDILDGQLYQRLSNNNGPLSNLYNFSYIFNTDGVNPMDQGTLKVYPLYARINELPPELRQKFYFPVAVYVDHCEPNIQAFLKPFVRQASRLAEHGLIWKPDGVNEVTSKFIPLGFTVDSPVRYTMLKLSKWDSEYGCTYCTNPGIREAGSQRYPFVHIDGLPPFHDRSHEGMMAAMRLVEENDEVEHYQGHKGASVLMLLAPHHLDLRDGQAVDDLHQDYEGSAAHLTELLVTTPEARVDENMPRAQLMQTIDTRLLRFKTPSCIARKPRSIVKRTNWKGSEWRNWILYYAVPCLTGLIKDEYLNTLSQMSHAFYLLSQDVIEPGDIDLAEQCLIIASTSFELIFGVGKIRYNFHVSTRHKVRSVRNLGNPFASSTSFFESLNRKTIGKVTSPKGAIMQIVTRLIMSMSVNAAQYDERLSEGVRLRIEDILNPYRIKQKQEIGPHLYLVGSGKERAINQDEAEVLAHEGINVLNIMEYSSFLFKSTRYWSTARQDPDIKSDDTFIYTFQDTFCTIRTIFSMDINGEEHYGAFVLEHDVHRVVQMAGHLSELQDPDADLLHFLPLHQVRCPAIKMSVGNVVYAVCVPNTMEID